MSDELSKIRPSEGPVLSPGTDDGDRVSFLSAIPVNPSHIAFRKHTWKAVYFYRGTPGYQRYVEAWTRRGAMKKARRFLHQGWGIVVTRKAGGK